MVSMDNHSPALTVHSMGAGSFHDVQATPERIQLSLWPAWPWGCYAHTVSPHQAPTEADTSGTQTKSGTGRALEVGQS